MAGQPSHRPVCREDIALDLGQRDRAFGRTAVEMADRIARILPALVEQPELGAALVFDEAVAVEVPGVLDPAERRKRVRPQPIEQRVVAGPGVGLGQQDQPQRGRVDAPVVGVVWRLAGPRHLAGAHLVQDLAGLGVVPRIVVGRLETAEDLERGLRQRRHERDRLEPRDQAVAAEQGREPRDPGGQVRLAFAGTVVAQRGEVGQRADHGAVEQFVVGLDPRRIERPLAGRRRGPAVGRTCRAAHRVGGRRAVVVLAGRDLPADGRAGTRLELHQPRRDDGRAGPGVGVGGRVEPRVGRNDGRRPTRAIEAVVGEGRPVSVEDDRQERPALRARVAADFEDVGHVDAERELQPEMLDGG